jgi:hypothetical protein
VYRLLFLVEGIEVFVLRVRGAGQTRVNAKDIL